MNVAPVVDRSQALSAHPQRTSVWIRPLQDEQERADEIAHEERLYRRYMRRLVAETVAGCCGSCVLGLVIAAWGFHTTDVGLGKIFVSAGILVSDVGVLATLARFVARSTE